ncbi:MAG: type IV pilus secretin PilQ [Nitrospirae bacterium]|nr:type IV pilus secretin PilQ [Nitrospirota bacterium]
MDTTKFVLKIVLLILFLFLPVAYGEDEKAISIEKEKQDAGAKKAAEPLYSMEFRDADLKDVLRALGQENNLNIIISEKISGKLTLSFNKVKLMDAIDTILRISNLTYNREGNIMMIVASPFGEGEEGLVTKKIPVDFANAKEVSESLKNMLSSKGKITIDQRTNAIIVKDVAENVARISNLIKSLDTKTPQVMIEARIVEARSGFSRELGVQWGGDYSGNITSRGRTTGNYLLSGGGTKAASTDTTYTPLTGGIGIGGTGFLVNLPAAVGLGSGGAIGFSLVKNNLGLDLQLSAMEITGKGKILSNPKILTLDNKEAKISSGRDIPIKVLTTVSGVTTTEIRIINASLSLTVTPHITSDDQIVMNIKAEKAEPDWTRQVDNIPTIIKKNATTDMIIRNGDTIVIGGIYTKEVQDSEAGVPFLSKIPILGWLFKKQGIIDEQNELLIFITPTVMKERV